MGRASRPPTAVQAALRRRRAGDDWLGRCSKVWIRSNWMQWSIRWNNPPHWSAPSIRPTISRPTSDKASKRSLSCAEPLFHLFTSIRGAKVNSTTSRKRAPRCIPPTRRILPIGAAPQRPVRRRMSLSRLPRNCRSGINRGKSCFAVSCRRPTQRSPLFVSALHS